MYLHEAISSGKKFKRQKEDKGIFLTLNERTEMYGLATDDLTASDWITEEIKTDKILAAELVIRLLENLTNEINKHNQEIRQEVKELREKLDAALNKPIYINNSGVSLDPLIPYTMKTGDPTQPIATVLDPIPKIGDVFNWSKTNE